MPNDIIGVDPQPQPQIPQPLEVVSVYTDKNAFIMECAMRLFMNVSFETAQKSEAKIANDCVSKATILYKSLRKAGVIT